MSSIRIECRKDVKSDMKDYNKKNESTGNEMIIVSEQWFMDTEKFFKTVQNSLKEYFDSIKKK